MKKLNLLSRAEMRNVMGGVFYIEEEGGVGRCSTGSCTIDVSGYGNQPGKCEANSANKCVCKALDYPSSALSESCVK